jgi:UDP-glucose 4-epimerase
MLKIAIFGGNGYIGSFLTNYYSHIGHQVYSLTRYSFYNSHVHAALEEVEVVINCVGSSSVNSSFTNVQHDFQSNTDFVRVLLELIKEKNLIKKINVINLSSAAVYGNPHRLPIHESFDCKPLSPYGYHKLISELFMKEYNICFGMKTLSLRLFSAYGEGQRKLLLWDLHHKIHSGDGTIILLGTGKESRDFIHILDIAHQILLAIEHADFNGETLNVANGEEVEISEIVKLYQIYYPKKFVYEFNGLVRPGDPSNWCADISTMKNWGYQNEIGIEQGIENYINWAVCQ